MDIIGIAIQHHKNAAVAQQKGLKTRAARRDATRGRRALEANLRDGLEIRPTRRATRPRVRFGDYTPPVPGRPLAGILKRSAARP